MWPPLHGHREGSHGLARTGLAVKPDPELWYIKAGRKIRSEEEEESENFPEYEQENNMVKPHG